MDIPNICVNYFASFSLFFRFYYHKLKKIIQESSNMRLRNSGWVSEWALRVYVPPCCFTETTYRRQVSRPTQTIVPVQDNQSLHFPLNAEARTHCFWVLGVNRPKVGPESTSYPGRSGCMTFLVKNMRKCIIIRYLITLYRAYLIEVTPWS